MIIVTIALILCHIIIAPIAALADNTASDNITAYSGSPLIKIDLGGQVGIAHSDNIFRAENGETSDSYFLISPAVRLRTYYDDFDLTGRLVTESATFFEQDQNNYLDLDLRLQGAYHLNPNTDLIIRTRLRKDHVDIGAFDDDPDQLADEPADFRTAQAEVGIEHRLERHKAYAAIESFLLNYDNVARVGTGEPVINDDRDRIETIIKLRGDTAVTDYYRIYSSVHLNRRDYDQQIDSTLLNPRDSQGYEWLAGIALGEKKHHTFYGEIGMGLLQQSYDTGFFPDVRTYGLRGDITWQPDRENQLRMDARREVGEVTTSTASSYVQTTLRLRGKHQLNNLWRMGGLVQFRRNDFQVNPLADVGRIDDIYQFELFSEYAIDEKFDLGFSLKRQQRISDRVNTDYTRYIGLLYLSAPY